jgi:membrane protease YdiL (CAAX protease family)
MIQPGLRELNLWKFLGWVILIIIISSIVSVLIGLITDNDEIGVFSAGLLIYMFIFLWCRRRLKKSGNRFRDFLSTDLISYSWIRVVGISFLQVIFSLSLIMTIFYVLTFISPTWFERLVMQEQLIYSDYLLLVLELLFISTIVPIVEELIFRGIILDKWSEKWGITLSIVLSSILFAVVHFQWLLFSQFIFGMIAAVLYLKTRTLLVPIVAHAINNFAVGLGSLLDTSGSTVTVNQLTEEVRAVGPISFVVFVCTLPFVVKFLRKHWPKETVISNMKG